MDSYKAGSIIYRNFNTHQDDGTPITLAGTPSIKIYKDDSTTEDDSGITLTVDFDSKTGLHNVKVDTSQDGTFYANGHDFSAVISAGTVDGISVVGTEIFRFRLQDGFPTASENAEALLNHAVSGHLTAGTVGNLVSSLGGKMTVTSNQLIVYASDNATELFRFDLTDSSGSPSMTDVYTRTIHT